MAEPLDGGGLDEGLGEDSINRQVKQSNLFNNAKFLYLYSIMSFHIQEEVSVLVLFSQKLLTKDSI